MDNAVRSKQRPFFVSDSGDNPGAGGADDCTAALAALAGEPAISSGELPAVLASIVDPATVQHAIELGEGNQGEFTIGGVIDSRDPGPQALTATVAQVTDTPDGGTSARLVHGGLEVIVTSRRTQYAQSVQYQRMRVDPSAMDIVVVKMGYLEPDLFDLQRGWLLALTPDGVEQDLKRLGHQRILRPMIPFDDEIPEPTEVTAFA